MRTRWRKRRRRRRTRWPKVRQRQRQRTTESRQHTRHDGWVSHQRNEAHLALLAVVLDGCGRRSSSGGSDSVVGDGSAGSVARGGRRGGGCGGRSGARGSRVGLARRTTLLHSETLGSLGEGTGLLSSERVPALDGLDHAVDLARVVAAGVDLAGEALGVRVLRHRSDGADEGENRQEGEELHGVADDRGRVWGWVVTVQCDSVGLTVCRVSVCQTNVGRPASRELIGEREE